MSDNITSALLNSSDVQLIDDEIFDFDLPFSPEREADGIGAGGDSAKQKVDDEVFFGPVGFTEKCIAAGVEEDAYHPISPLGPEQTVELFVEAHSVACRIENLKMSERSNENSPARSTRSASVFRNLGQMYKQFGENQENVSPRKRRRSNTFTKESPTDGVKDCSGKKHERKGTFTKDEPVEALALTVNSLSDTKDRNPTTARPGAIPRGGSKLQLPASKLRRYNNSQPNLAKPKTGKAEAAGVKDAQRNSTASSLVSLGARKSLQLLKSSGQLSSRESRLALPSQKASAPSSETVQKNHYSSNPTSTEKSLRKSSGIPATRPQLMKPGGLQRRSFATGVGKGAAQSGPMKAPPPSSSKPKMGDTVERPYNPALAAAAGGNSQCPSTPAGKRRLQPKSLSSSSDASTPARSSCSSTSACGSTPGSVSKRLSQLPTPSQRRSISSSMPPPSPMSMRSSTSSLSKRSVASSSDDCESHVFDTKSTRRISGAKASCTNSDLDGPGASPIAFKSRKPLVQNTPDLPKRTLSRWSPLRKQRPAAFEDQVSMCTKRVTPT